MYSNGSIFTATKCIFKTHLNSSIRPESNQAIIEPTEESPPSNHSKRDTPPHMPESTLSAAISTEHTASSPRQETIPVVLGEQVSSNVSAIIEASEPTVPGVIVTSEQVLPNLCCKLPMLAKVRPCDRRTRTFSDTNLAYLQKKTSTTFGSVSLPQLQMQVNQDCERYHHEERFQLCENEGINQHQWERDDETHSRIYSSVQEEVS